MPQPIYNLANYLALNQELHIQQDWFLKKLQNHKRSRQKYLEIQRWESRIPTEVMQNGKDTISRLHASLEWYRGQPWYKRWWLRQTTNVGWVARFYLYKRSHHVLNQWGAMHDSYSRLQKVQQEGQRYLSTFSWDRIKLKQSFQRIDKYWQQTIFAAQFKVINKQRPAVMKNELISLLKKAEKALENAASSKTEGFLSPTYGKLAQEKKYGSKASIVCEGERQSLAAAASRVNAYGWLGRFNRSKSIHIERQVLYFVLLSRSINNLLKLLEESKNKPHGDNFNAAWSEFERLATEGAFLSSGYRRLINKPSKIWNIYDELLIGFSQLAFNPRASMPNLDGWQQVVHKTGGWFHTVLQFLSGNSASCNITTDQRLCIEHYVDLASVYEQAINQGKEYLAKNSAHEQIDALNGLLKEMEHNVNSLWTTLAQMQQQTVLSDIQRLGNHCNLLLGSLHSQLEQLNIIGANNTTRTAQSNASSAQSAGSGSFKPSSKPSSTTSSSRSSPRSEPTETTASAAAAAPALSETNKDEYLVVPTTFDERRLFIEACKILELTILSSQTTVTLQKVRQAYKKRARETHPDKNQDQTTELFKQVNLAYHYLHDTYKQQLEHGVRSQPEFNNTMMRAQHTMYEDIRRFCNEPYESPLQNEYTRREEQIEASFKYLNRYVEYKKQLAENIKRREEQYKKQLAENTKRHKEQHQEQYKQQSAENIKRTEEQFNIHDENGERLDALQETVLLLMRRQQEFERNKFAHTGDHAQPSADLIFDAFSELTTAAVAASLPSQVLIDLEYPVNLSTNPVRFQYASVANVKESVEPIRSPMVSLI